MAPSSTTAAAVQAELGRSARLGGSPAARAIAIGDAALWAPGDDVPRSDSIALVLSRPDDDAVRAVAAAVPSHDARVVVLAQPSPGIDLGPLRPHAHITTERTAGDVISIISRATASPEQGVSRRLASAQRSLTLALSDPEPLPSLLERLQRLSSATVALLDDRGDVLEATGAMPVAALSAEIARTAAEVQHLDIDGWRGVAIRISDPTREGAHAGWLVAVSRREGFPDEHITAVAYVAAGLVEATLTISVVARRQEQAVRTAVLEEVLAVRSEVRRPELDGRVRSLGLSFEAPLRMVVVRPDRARSGENDTGAVAMLQQAFAAASAASVAVRRGDGVVVLAQADDDVARRVLRELAPHLPPHVVGIGRDANDLGDIVDSHRDAELAVRALRRAGRDVNVMTYEEFDFATRVLSDVGLDRMIARARELVAPLEDRDALLEGLHAFFDHAQNFHAAADALGIHANSLRYRLSRVEELLGLNLREPAATASLYLALTALSLGGEGRTATVRPAAKPSAPGRSSKAGVPDSPTAFPAAQPGFGATLGEP